MQNKETFSKLLHDDRPLGRYPMEMLRKVDKPTTAITDNIERFDERNHGFARAARGDYGKVGDMMKMSEGIAASASMAALMSELGVFRPARDIPPDSPPVSGSHRSQRADPPVPVKIDIPGDPAVMSRHIKSMAYFIGADIVGICELPQWAVYSHDRQGNPVDCNHKYAVCIAVDQGRETMEASTGDDWISGAQSGRAYALSGYVGHVLSRYIQMLGYPSRLHYAADYQVIVPPLLVLSGIGELSRANIVLNPFLGLRYKASVVTTDLPLVADKPVDFGLQDFCDKCRKCAVECPSRSISAGDKVMTRGYENWEFNAETCTKFRLANPHGIACGKCIKVCPWNKPEGWTHDLVRWMVRHTPAMNKLIIKMDDLLGYGKPDKARQWWFDPVKEGNKRD